MNQWEQYLRVLKMKCIVALQNCGFTELWLDMHEPGCLLRHSQYTVSMHLTFPSQVLT